MFISIKNLSIIMDKEINFVKEAKDNRANIVENEFLTYMKKMEATLNARLNTLKKISSNNKLILKYEKLISDLFK